MTPNFQAQMRGDAAPYDVAYDVVTRVYMQRRLPASDGPELYLPYIGPVPASVVSVPAMEERAVSGLSALFDAYQTFLEGRNNGCV